MCTVIFNVDKALLEFTFVHTLLWEYVQELQAQGRITKIEELAHQLSEALPKLLTTKPGAHILYRTLRIYFQFALLLPK